MNIQRPKSAPSEVECGRLARQALKADARPNRLWDGWSGGGDFDALETILAADLRSSRPFSDGDHDQ